MFWQHADEERSHAIQFIQYLRMRGATDNDFFGDGPVVPVADTYTWAGVSEALTMALDMEKMVTGKMKDMIDVCTRSVNGVDDPHAADWLTGESHHVA
jgi:ferritin